jgi:hypothetical protein
VVSLLQAVPPRAGRISASARQRVSDEGLHLGYRKGQAAGKWVVRHYAGEQSYTLETIGTADDTIDPDGMTILSFAQAQAIARQRFVEGKRLAAGQPPVGGAYTVKDAIADYLAWMVDCPEVGLPRRLQSRPRRPGF